MTQIDITLPCTNNLLIKLPHYIKLFMEISNSVILGSHHELEAMPYLNTRSVSYKKNNI